MSRLSRFEKLRGNASVTNFKNSNALGGVFTALDRTLSGLSMVTSISNDDLSMSYVGSGTGPFNYDPAQFDPTAMRLTLKMPRDGDLVSDEGLIRATGYNYHELSHLIYGPPSSVNNTFIGNVVSQIEKSVSSDRHISGSTIRNLVQVLMCLQSDHRILRQYLGIAPYLIEVLIDRLRVGSEHYKSNVYPNGTAVKFASASYVLFAGRLYFPRSFREYMKEQFVYGLADGLMYMNGLSVRDARLQALAVADDVEKNARLVAGLNFYDKSQDHRGILIEAGRVFTEALIPFRGYFDISYLNIFHSHTTDSTAQTVPDYLMNPDAARDLQKVRRENNENAEQSPDIPENTDGYGQEDGEEDGQGAGDGDSEEGEGESEDNGGQGGEDGADGQSEGTGHGDTDDAEESEEPAVADGSAPGTQTGNHDPENVFQQFDDLSDYVQGDTTVQDEVRERRRAVTNPSGKQLLTFANRTPTRTFPVTPEMTLLAKRIGQEFTGLTEDADPGFVKSQSSGRLNIQRAMTGEVELDSLFDRWDEGQVDATEVEIVYLVDISGSMSNDLDRVCRALWVLKSGIEQSSNNSGVTALAYDTEMTIIAGAEEVEDRTRYRLISSAGGTDPLDALKAAEGILNSSQRKNRLMVILTDGQWGNTSESEEVIQRLNHSGVSTGLMFYHTYGGVQVDPHGCTVSQKVSGLSDVLSFTRTMVRNTMTI